MNTRVEGLALGLGVLSVAAIIIGLSTDTDVLGEWLLLLAGIWVGFFSVWGAFRLFNWGESAATSIYLWVGIGGALVVVLYLVVLTIWSWEYPHPLADIIYWTALGFVIGAAGTAQVIARRLREEERGP